MTARFMWAPTSSTGETTGKPATARFMWAPTSSKGGVASASVTLVLVVSTDPSIIEGTRLGFPPTVDVTHVDDAREAARSFAARTPDVVVMDIHTGSAGGFALARDMASDPRLAFVPFVMLLERPQDAWLASQAGAAVHRVKPVAVTGVVDDVMRLLPAKAAE